MYYLFPLTLCILMYLFRKNKKTTNFLFVVFIVFFAIRFPLGRDIPAYTYLVEHNTYPITFGNGRFTFLIFYYTLYNHIFDTPEYFFTICACLTIGISLYAIYKYSNNLALSCFLWATSGFAQVYLQSVIRQAFVMAVFLWAYFRYLRNKQYLQYTVAILLASTFHDAGLIALTLIPLEILINKITPKIQILLITTCLVIGLLLGPLLSIYGECLGWYYEYLKNYQISILGIGLQIVLFSFTLLIYYFQTDKDDTDCKRFLLINSFAYAFYCLMIGYQLTSRFTDFIQILNLIFIPIHLNKIKNKIILKITFTGLLSLNLSLLFLDIYDNCKVLGVTEKINFFSYPYRTYFDFDTSELNTIYINP